MAYRIEFSSEAETHFRALTRRQQSQVLDEVEKRLAHEPDVETRNRKPMRPNPLATWELRIDNLRVYYDIETVEQVVVVLAIGVKSRNKVRIGGKEIEL